MGASLSNMFLLKSNLQTLLPNHCQRHSSLSFVLLSLVGNHLTSAEGVWDLSCLRHHIYLLGLAGVNLLSIFYGSLLLLPSSSFLPECELVVSPSQTTTVSLLSLLYVITSSERTLSSPMTTVTCMARSFSESCPLQLIIFVQK